jgi:hypothetical protein
MKCRPTSRPTLVTMEWNFGRSRSETRHLTRLAHQAQASAAGRLEKLPADRQDNPGQKADYDDQHVERLSDGPQLG